MIDQYQDSYIPIKADKVNICMAYLSYIGQNIVQGSDTENIVYQKIKAAIPKVESLLGDGGKPDWKIVWGPLIYTFPSAKLQDNCMFVAQQISEPKNYIVAVRGTNGKALQDWIREDFDVLLRRKWPGCAGARISEATYTGISKLRKNKGTVRDGGDNTVGERLTLTEFLEKQVTSQAINVTFTGHSLGGALAPTLALHFKQYQAEWDSKKHSTVSCAAFAGATAGNKKFADFSNQIFAKNSIRRIHNCNDVVPHAWNSKTLAQIKTLYKDFGIKFPLTLHIVLFWVIFLTKCRRYTQIKQSISFAWDARKCEQCKQDSICQNPKHNFWTEALCQHVESYPIKILGAEQGIKLREIIAEENKTKDLAFINPET